MASRKELPLKNVAGAIGLAAGWLLVLFLWAGRAGSELSADARVGAGQGRAAEVETEAGDVSVSFTSTQPITILLTRDQVKLAPWVWEIAEHSVNITFAKLSVQADAWFTFTPQISGTINETYLPTPYFFELGSRYVSFPDSVSLTGDGIQIEVTFEEAHLGPKIDPSTLQFFHYGTTKWEPKGGDLDLQAKTISLWTKRTERFAVGGEPYWERAYLPLAFHK